MIKDDTRDEEAWAWGRDARAWDEEARTWNEDEDEDEDEEAQASWTSSMEARGYTILVSSSRVLL